MARRVRSYQKVVERLQRVSYHSPHITLNQIGVISAAARRIYPFHLVSIGDSRTRRSSPIRRICLTAGVHGNEPSGVEAVLSFLEQHREKKLIDRGIHLHILPCINPFGYEYNTRENGQGIDLNRQFRKRKPPLEVALVRRGLGSKPFDLSMEFHEDVDTQGFYLYELAPPGSRGWGHEIIRVIEKDYTVNHDPQIDGMPSRNGIISRQQIGEDFAEHTKQRRDWPQAFYQYSRGTLHCITSETPVILPLQERAKMHLIALEIALQHLGSPPVLMKNGHA